MNTSGAPAPRPQIDQSLTSKPWCAGPRPIDGLTFRHFLNRFRMGLGGIALAYLPGPAARAVAGSLVPSHGGILTAPHLPPKEKRIIYLFMAGGPSQLETLDYKPLLKQRNGENLPESVRMGQRLTAMSGNQAILPLAGSQ